MSTCPVPPRPEAIIDAIIKLRKKISNESMQERDQIKQTHRYYSTTHNMKVVDPILTGKYLQSQTRISTAQGTDGSNGNAGITALSASRRRFAVAEESKPAPAPEQLARKRPNS